MPNGADGEEDLTPSSLNIGAVAGLVVFGLVAAVALFGLPLMLEYGIGFMTAFWFLSAVEFICALGVAVSAMKLFSDDS